MDERPDCPTRQASHPIVGIIGGLIAIVASVLFLLVRILNVTKNKLACYEHRNSKKQSSISSKQYVSIKMLMDEMEAKVNGLEVKPDSEDEDKLHVALSRVSNLEQEISTTKKVLQSAFARQHEIVAYLDERKKKRSLGKSLRQCFRRAMCAS